MFTLSVMSEENGRCMSMYCRPSEFHSRSRIMCLLSCDGASLTCNEANISISSSVQSISSSRMDQRACSYSWVILTASYWNTGADARSDLIQTDVCPDVVFRAQDQKKKKKKIPPRVSHFFGSLTLGLRSKKTLYLKRSSSLSSCWMSCSMRERDESNHLLIRATTDQKSWGWRYRPNYTTMESYRSNFWSTLHCWLLCRSVREAGTSWLTRPAAGLAGSQPGGSLRTTSSWRTRASRSLGHRWPSWSCCTLGLLCEEKGRQMIKNHICQKDVV